jgi:hypothetical protein
MQRVERRLLGGDLRRELRGIPVAAAGPDQVDAGGGDPRQAVRRRAVREADRKGWRRYGSMSLPSRDAAPIDHRCHAS